MKTEETWQARVERCSIKGEALFCSGVEPRLTRNFFGTKQYANERPQPTTSFGVVFLKTCVFVPQHGFHSTYPSPSLPLQPLKLQTRQVEDRNSSTTQPCTLEGRAVKCGPTKICRMNLNIGLWLSLKRVGFMHKLA